MRAPDLKSNLVSLVTAWVLFVARDVSSPVATALESDPVFARDIRPCCGCLIYIRYERRVVPSSSQGFQSDLDPFATIENVLGNRGDPLGGTRNQVGRYEDPIAHFNNHPGRFANPHGRLSNQLAPQCQYRAILIAGTFLLRLMLCFVQILKVVHMCRYSVHMFRHRCTIPVLVNEETLASLYYVGHGFAQRGGTFFESVVHICDMTRKD